MIPEFNDLGYLPPGVHVATLAEVEARFGRESELRRVQMESLHWLVDLAKRAGVERLIVNGSFVTDAYEPNDVDCALLVEPESLRERGIEEEVDEGLPFIELHVVGARQFQLLVEKVYGSDREFVPKGVIEIKL